MPAVSERQRRFFGLIRGVQKGKVRGVSSRIKKLAKKIPPSVVREFASKKKRRG